MVIGAGQAGLSAAYHLRRRGLRPFDDFVVLDADDAPGGAWQHRPPTLTMAMVHGFHELPDAPLPPLAPQLPARDVLPQYFAAYERDHELPVVRPVTVTSVRALSADPQSLLLTETDHGSFSSRAIINATGTWTRPFLPRYPGMERFRGRMLHSSAYQGPEEFRGGTVLVVGGGASAIQILAETAAVARTLWVTRRPPVFREERFVPEELGRAAVAMVAERVRAGLPPASVVSVTGLPPSPALLRARELDALHRLPLFERITETGVVWADGHEEAVDAIVWATGFRAAVGHLAPLGLREPGGGIRMDGTQAARDPRVHLVGYGPSASTIGANRAGRAAAVAVDRHLRGGPRSSALLGADLPARAHAG
ncbi:Predicted flavoprotein CzcO associated with the cation diffusion facilitator CzcD [Streptacidiphilus jiangxiensis]|uniref:Predicted flavoprotein CzcO associated with the cation diffusion facilitator CzcD n=1 Tax=Streptacidiphilus jiangxiensis TaxID=235985 RepID=A0A1H7Y8G4_STRJI|nr:Predicted flavoprotein CzcO associated with the cation diffusion facilitator CzcD [Streptacidiphilus jiangxiensis]